MHWWKKNDSKIPDDNINDARKQEFISTKLIRPKQTNRQKRWGMTLFTLLNNQPTNQPVIIYSFFHFDFININFKYQSYDFVLHSVEIITPMMIINSLDFSNDSCVCLYSRLFPNFKIFKSILNWILNFFKCQCNSDSSFVNAKFSPYIFVSKFVNVNNIYAYLLKICFSGCFFFFFFSSFKLN